MRKVNLLAASIIILFMSITGCQEKIPDVYNEPVKKRIIPNYDEIDQAVSQGMPPAPGMEIKTVQQKTDEEKARDAQAAELALARSNPFLTQEEEENFKETQGRIIIEDMNLSAVMYSPPNSKAIINGVIVKEGGTLGSKKIIEIQPKAVIMKDEVSKREYILKTKNAAEK